jgi:uncharacterized membrane protein YhaH (DUF805 family)
MDFKQAVTICLRKYVDFSGRAGRAEFWWFVLFTVIVGVVTGMINDYLAALVNLALLLPSIAVGSRRFHDVDKSGWFQLVWLVPLLGWAVAIYFLAQPSTPPNKYGTGPELGPDVAALPPGAA